jgi:O-antigen/teichoic acid export membrane protein
MSDHRTAIAIMPKWHHRLMRIAGMSQEQRIWPIVGRLLTGKAAAAVISLGTLAITARMLGAHAYGVLNLVHAYIVLIGGIFVFSGWHGLVRFGHDALTAGEGDRFRALVRFTAQLEFGLFVVAACITALLAPRAAVWLDWPKEAAAFAPLYALAIFATVRTTPHAILQIAGRFDLLAWHQIIMPTARLGGVLLLSLVGGELQQFLWVWLVSALLEGASMWIMGWRVLHAIPVGGVAGARGAVDRAYLAFIAITNLDITLRELAPRAVPLIVGWRLGPTAAGLFAVAQKAGVLLEQPAQLLGHASYAVAAKLAAAGRTAESRRMIAQGVAMATLLAIPLTVVASLYAMPLMALLGGAGFSAGAAVLVLIVVARMLLIGAPALTAALTALKRPGLSMLINVATNIGLLVSLPPMLDRFGLAGAGWYLLAQALVTMLALLILTDRAFRRDVRTLSAAVR